MTPPQICYSNTRNTPNKGRLSSVKFACFIGLRSHLASVKNNNGAKKVKAIEKGGLLIIPRVTDMRNGFFRPEVAFSKGRASDIIFGECFENRMRAQLLATLSANAAIASAPAMETFWSEMSRAVNTCQMMIENLNTIIG